MSLLDWLRRLGIFRYGAEASAYRNAKERPISLQMDDVFDSKRDVVHFDKPKDTSSEKRDVTDDDRRASR